jgi:hypothetical protein
MRPWGLAIAGLLLISGTAFAGRGQWTTTGPAGDAQVASVAVDFRGGVVAGTGSGLFRLKADREWTNLGITGVSAPSVGNIAIDPSNPDVLYAFVSGEYAGTDGDGIYKSSDAGASWTLAYSTAGGRTYAIAVDPVNSQIVYAANEFLGHGVNPTSTTWVSRSLDGGTTWSLPNSNSVGAHCLAIDPTFRSTVYAGGLGVFRSPDSGEHWTALQTGLADGYVFAVAVDPHDSSKVYAALGAFTTPQFGVLKSSDGGEHWELESQGLPEDALSSLVIDPIHPNVLYAGSFDQGVFRSVDSGITWGPMNSGLSNPTIYSLAMDPTGSRLFAGTAAGVYEISPASIAVVPPLPLPVSISGRDALRPLER